MSKEHIEREAAKERLRIWITDCLLNEANEAADCFKLCIDLLDSIPAADVAPVVRCKDCRWRGREDCAMFYRCNCGEQHTWETDNDFCSYGEKIDT